MKRKYIFFIAVLGISTIFGWQLHRITSQSVLSNFDSRSIFGTFLPQYSKTARNHEFKKIAKVADEKTGTYSIFIKNLNTDETYKLNETELFYAASLYKTPIAASVFRLFQEGTVSSEDKVTYWGIDYSDGTGTIYYSPVGTEFTVDYVLDQLLKNSDNVGQNILIRTYGASNIKKGFNIIKSENRFFDDNTSTVAVQAEFYENLVESDFLTQNNKEILLNKMSVTSFDDRINTGLNPDVKFSHKIGNWGDTGSWHDCGIASKDGIKIVVCVMSRYTTYNDVLEITKSVGNFVNILF